MTVPSNLYAEKIFAEHPVSLWALDDTVDYISLISESNRNIASTSWTKTGVSASVVNQPDEPFPDSVNVSLVGDVPTSATGTFTCVSPNIINFTSLDPDLETFCIGGYFYADSPLLSAVSIGFQYTDTITSNVVQQLKRFETSIRDQWTFISGTFEAPSQNTNLRIVLEFEYNNTASPSTSDYQFYFNGLSLGQWSENFASQSLGISPISLPTNIPLTTNKCVPADQYGLGGTSGYYLVQDNTLKARNSSIPMVYGGAGITTLRPNDNEPSLIVPGEGFLNEAGKYQTYGIEFWMRIDSSTISPKRIFGPIASTDGLYVEGAFLTLKIGNLFQSHFIGEWFRPMLVNINLINNSIGVLINGEEVISIAINTDSLDLPAITNSSGDSQDWLGFYAYDDVGPFEIDCVAIYSYSIVTTVAKRRWVYGQAVPSVESLNSSFGGSEAFIDYTFADYTANYNYPDFANWDQGTFDNLTTTQNVLRTPAYTLPEILIGTKTLEELYADNLDEQDPLDYPFITFRPNASWNDIQCSFNLPRFNIVNEGVHAIYGVFASDDLLSEEMLFKIYNPFTGNYFTIKKDGDIIKYSLVYNGVEEEIVTTEDLIVENEKYAVGIEISTISEYFGGNVAAFFGNQNGLKMYIGGDETNLYQFTGKIYSFGLCTSYNANEIADHFKEDGTVILDSHTATGSEESANALALLNHTASYTVLPTSLYGEYYLDIGVSGYWEDYLPLSYFGQFVQNKDDETYYDLDFIQFNINYPRLSYSTEDNDVRAYITFQYISEGANAPQSSFEYTEPPVPVIDATNYTNWRSTRFEIVDNCIIYPNKKVNFNDLAIVYHLDFNSRGILTKPITIRRLEFASQAFNSNTANLVNTRFGVPMFPFTRSGVYFDYKAKNPFSIYKGSTPYLYLNKDSGIEVRGEINGLITRGILIPINQTKSSDYKVSALQCWIRSDDEDPSFDTDPVEIFRLISNDLIIKFFMIATDISGQRAKIFAVDGSTGLPYNDFLIYVNGTLVSDPVITKEEWSSIGISFGSALTFDSKIGYLYLTGNLVFNNISYYKQTNLGQLQSNTTRPWLFVKSFEGNDFDWQHWLDSYKWQTVLIIQSSARYTTNPSDVYKAYIGTNKFIIDDEQGLEIIPDNLSLYSNISWLSNIATPV